MIKLTASKKAVMFIDDKGNTFITSAAFVMGLLQGKSKHNFVLLSRLPHKVAEGRFKKSELYDPSGLAKENEKHGTLTNANDALSTKAKKDKMEEVAYEDKKVW